MIIQGPGAGTRVLCAAYDYDHEVAHPLMSQLPPVLYVPAGMPATTAAWPRPCACSPSSSAVVRPGRAPPSDA